MTITFRGLIWCSTFFVLDSVQAVFFGNLFQRLDSFLVGGLVFGLSASGCLIWTYRHRRGDLAAALANRNALLGLNVTAAGAWVTYLIAIQLIEPAVAFTIFSGAIPLTVMAAGGLGADKTVGIRNTTEALGYAVLAIGMLVLAAVTLMGRSGFVRGDLSIALTGLSLAAFAGALIAGMLLHSHRLDRAGVGPVAQFGLRFPLYLLLALGGFLLGLDNKGPFSSEELLIAVMAGLVLLAVPIYAVQMAVSLTSTLTIGAFAAAGPLLVFVLQIFEGRVTYAPATLIGLTIYFAGAMISAFGRARVFTWAGSRPD